MKKVVPIVIILFLLTAAGVGTYYYYQQNNKDKNLIEVSGNIEAKEVDIGAEVMGKVKELKKQEGDQVTKDEEVAKIDDRLLQAQVDQAKASLAVTQAKQDPTQIALAQASVDLAELNLTKSVVTSPIDGVVITRPYEEGEVVSPGATIYTVANLDEVSLVVYIPEDQLGKVDIGQKADVKVDSYPNRVFKGAIKKISDKAEFTPANVQTKEQRINLVFAVTISLENKDHKLKAGMPADATIRI